MPDVFGSSATCIPGSAQAKWVEIAHPSQESTPRNEPGEDLVYKKYFHKTAPLPSKSGCIGRQFSLDIPSPSLTYPNSIQESNPLSAQFHTVTLMEVPMVRSSLFSSRSLHVPRIDLPSLKLSLMRSLAFSALTRVSHSRTEHHAWAFTNKGVFKF